MNLFKKTEAMLYNFNKTKAEIKNIDLEIELTKSEFDGVGAIGYEERTGPTNKFNSSVENEVLIKEIKIGRLEKSKRLKEIEILKVENAMESLTEREKQIVEMRYFKKYNNRIIAAKLDLTEEYISEIKSKIISSITDILFLDKV